MILKKADSTTIFDVAKLAGVSTTTVTLVVNGRADKYRVSRQTQARVQTVIRQTGYVPNGPARNMKLGRRSFVGLVAAENAMPGAELLAGLEPVLAAAGYRLMVAMTPPDPAAVRDKIAGLLCDGAAGIFCLADTSGLKPDDPATTGPIVSMGRPAAGMVAVFRNDRQGGRMAARHLLNKGHRRIAQIRLAETNPTMADGFREVCAGAGVKTVEFKTVGDFMAVVRNYTAVCCGSSSILMRLYIRAAAAGVRIPGDLSVVAADELGVANTLAPPAVTLNRRERELGKSAADLMLAALRNEEVENLRLDWELTAGESVAPPARGAGKVVTAKAVESAIIKETPAPEPAHSESDPQPPVSQKPAVVEPSKEEVAPTPKSVETTPDQEPTTQQPTEPTPVTSAPTESAVEPVQPSAPDVSVPSSTPTPPQTDTPPLESTEQPAPTPSIQSEAETVPAAESKPAEPAQGSTSGAKVGANSELANGVDKESPSVDVGVQSASTANAAPSEPAPAIVQVPAAAAAESAQPASA